LAYKMVKNCETVDFESALKALVEDSATVSLSYGGFEIVANKPSKLKWHKIFSLILEMGHEVWVERKNDKLVVVLKPPSV